jgi:hypothetical protein
MVMLIGMIPEAPAENDIDVEGRVIVGVAKMDAGLAA